MHSQKTPFRLVPTVYGEWDDVEQAFESLEGILIIDRDGTHIATLPGVFGGEGEGMNTARFLVDALNQKKESDHA